MKGCFLIIVSIILLFFVGCLTTNAQSNVRYDYPGETRANILSEQPEVFSGNTVTAEASNLEPIVIKPSQTIEYQQDSAGYNHLNNQHQEINSKESHKKMKFLERKSKKRKTLFSEFCSKLDLDEENYLEDSIVRCQEKDTDTNDAQEKEIRFLEIGFSTNEGKNIFYQILDYFLICFVGAMIMIAYHWLMKCIELTSTKDAAKSNLWNTFLVKLLVTFVFFIMNVFLALKLIERVQ